MFLKNILNILLMCLLFNTTVLSSGTKVIKHPQPQTSLQVKWDWAVEKSDQYDDGFWAGYSFEQTMGKNSFTGTFYSGSDRHKYDTLEKIIYNRGEKKDDSISLSEAAKKALNRMDNNHDDESHIQVVKEIAVLIYFKNNSIDAEDITDIRISNISLHANLKNKPLVWLGICAQDESVDFLIKMYPDIVDNDVKEDLLTAIGMHRESKNPIEFLSKIIQSDEINDIREKAVFWLGEHSHEESLDLLVKTAHTDRSGEVRKKAVFAIYLMDNEKADETLIQLAKNADRQEIRKKAIFWLGQKAANKSAEVLEEIVHDENDTEIKNQAVFALSQLDDNEGVPALIEIAKTHKNNEVRKKAIFWLGESEDSRALEAIVDIVRK